ncbi:hypothetical protein NQK81_21795 [Amycolatopsis roodepoortensis]|uniref:hypothetical protein n=1 Tax=Amycolatopsis roodepoortensis TaxID=700274 RepID=UPI00214AD675|nr:hypothetical protein [Amycolatopsis roodepoortensis]UUV35957.1 hypothetical protein NQK81_21795 [Amycolatopsis roodepoortensis]
MATELLLAAYRALRDEIVKKMDHRTALVVCSVTVSSAVLGFGIDRKSAPLLLVSPLVSLLLGILILFTNSQIGMASDYLRTRFNDPLLAPRHKQVGWHTSNMRIAYRFGLQTLNFRFPLALIAGSPVVVSVPIALSNVGSWAVTAPILIVVLLLLIVYTIQTFTL